MNSLTSQIDDLRNDLQIDIEYLGIVVNLYDSRRGYIATSSLQGWVDIKDPRVVGLVGDLKEQKGSGPREAAAVVVRSQVAAGCGDACVGQGGAVSKADLLGAGRFGGESAR